MQIKLKTKHITRQASGRDYLVQYLENQGIAPADVPAFIDEPRASDKDNPFLLANRKEALDAAYRLLSKGVEVYIQPDPDADGFTSSAVLYNYLKRRFQKCSYSWHLHDGKEHGIDTSYIAPTASLVFIPDAGTNDINEQEELSKQGRTVIVLDHHLPQDGVSLNKFKNVFIVNNQRSPDFPNKELSGVGIVYRFITAMEKTYFPKETSVADEYLDLTAVGIIADSRDRRALGNNYIAYYGLHNIRNRLLVELLRKRADKIKNVNCPTKRDVRFYIAPIINGVVRSGTADEKNLMFEAMAINEDPSDRVFKTTYRGVERTENLWEYAARCSANAKSRQDAAKRKNFKILHDYIIEKGWDKDNIIVATAPAEAEEGINANLTGLIAMELEQSFGKPCLRLRHTTYQDKPVLGGSGRNGAIEGLPSLLDKIQESNDILYAAGHDNAFGIFIEPDKVQDLRDWSNKAIDKTIFESDTVLVDYIFDQDDFDPERLNAFASAAYLYGKGIPEPSFGFSFNQYTYSTRGKNGDCRRIYASCNEEIPFVSLCDMDAVHRVGEAYRSQCPVNIVGRATINEYQGQSSRQILISSVEGQDHPGYIPEDKKTPISGLDLI